MANTTNFNWETPDDTDLVKDGAAAIRTLGSAIDTSLVDLKGGTTGQILSKTSNTDMDFTWIANDQGDITAVSAGTGLTGGGTSGSVSLAIDTTTTVDVSTAQTLTNKTLTSPVLTTPSISNIDAKGDLLVGTADNTIGRLAVGTNGYTLIADSAETTGIKWTALASSGMTLVKRASFSNVANTGTTFDNVFTSTYKQYLVILESISAATTSNDLEFQGRSGGSTKATGYYGGGSSNDYTGASAAVSVNNGSLFTLSTDVGGASGEGTSANIWVSQVGNTVENMNIRAFVFTGLIAKQTIFSGAISGHSSNFDGFLIKSSSSNITGTISVYGLAI